MITICNIIFMIFMMFKTYEVFELEKKNVIEKKNSNCSQKSIIQSVHFIVRFGLQFEQEFLRNSFQLEMLQIHTVAIPVGEHLVFDRIAEVQQFCGNPSEYRMSM